MHRDKISLSRRNIDMSFSQEATDISLAAQEIPKNIHLITIDSYLTSCALKVRKLHYVP